MQVRSPGKINLDLRIGPLRVDGFHDLVSWFVTIDLADELAFERSPRPGVSLKCSDSALPTDRRNLVTRAAEALLPSNAGVAITLDKRLPAGGGLGGGSSNAAATLLAMRALFELDLTDAALTSLAATLGSDVPFFLGSPSARCEGRGERITALETPAHLAAMLIFPPLSISTPPAFAKFDELSPQSTLVAPDYASWSQMPLNALDGLLCNDLEPAAFHLSSELAAMHIELQLKLGRSVRMSGSGSTLFALYADRAAATKAQQQLPEAVASFVTLLGHQSITVPRPLAALQR